MADWQTDIQYFSCHLEVAEELQCSSSHGQDPKRKPLCEGENITFWSNLDDETSGKTTRRNRILTWSVLAAIRNHFIGFMHNKKMHCPEFWRLRNPWSKCQHIWHLLSANSLTHTHTHRTLAGAALRTSDLSSQEHETGLWILGQQDSISKNTK